MSRTSHLNTLQWLCQADSVKVLESASALPSTCHNSRETILRLCLCMGMCLVCQRNTDPTVPTVYLLGLASMDILEIGDWRLVLNTQRIKDCFEPLLLFLQHFFLSATFFLHLLHSAGHTSICFWMPRCFSSMVVWFVLRSIKLTWINNTNLNGSQSWSIASQNPRSSNKVSLSCVCILSSIERERGSNCLHYLQRMNWQQRSLRATSNSSIRWETVLSFSSSCA